MDSATQFILGATIGQAAFTKPLGRKAALWGGIAGTIPDLDVIVVPFTGRIGEFAFHRGPTHSLAFAPLAAPLIGYAVWRWQQQRRDSQTPGAGPNDWRAWMWLFFWCFFTHPLLDIFTTYGTVLYWPFSWDRVALNAVGIIDPAYTLWLVAALVFGWALRKNLRAGAMAAWGAIAISTVFLFYGLALNARALDFARADLESKAIEADEIVSYPTVLQPYLRRVVARNDDAVYVGFLSTWSLQPITWNRFQPMDDERVETLLATRDGEVFRWFAMEQLAPKVTEDANGAVVEIDDIRYGFPGPAGQGIWGIRGHFDSDGNLDGPVEYYDRRPDATVGELARELFRASFQPAESPLTNGPGIPAD